MFSDQIQPPCITIRYGDKKYLLCADEVTNFLINCENIGLSSIPDITKQLEIIKMQLHLQNPNNPSVQLSLSLLEEMSTSLRACIFEDC